MDELIQKYVDALYKPDARASLKMEDLQKIEINNEYDLQHILYASLKPLFPDARTEVNHDTGVSTVRSDIWISSIDTVIEADIVHYQAKDIYFYIYDKKKIVKNPQAFKTGFHKVFDGKQVHVILIQPIML